MLFGVTLGTVGNAEGYHDARGGYHEYHGVFSAVDKKSFVI